MALEIERQVYNSVEAEIPAEKIGDMVMDSLKDVDQVAYVRFASVYRAVSYTHLDVYKRQVWDLSRLSITSKPNWM